MSCETGTFAWQVQSNPGSRPRHMKRSTGQELAGAQPALASREASPFNSAIAARSRLRCANLVTLRSFRSSLVSSIRREPSTSFWIEASTCSANPRPASLTWISSVFGYANLKRACSFHQRRQEEDDVREDHQQRHNNQIRHQEVKYPLKDLCRADKVADDPFDDENV
jgi:hypothetical protein